LEEFMVSAYDAIGCHARLLQVSTRVSQSHASRAFSSFTYRCHHKSLRLLTDATINHDEILKVSAASQPEAPPLTSTANPNPNPNPNTKGIYRQPARSTPFNKLR
jgi:hypothetical protein